MNKLLILIVVILIAINILPVMAQPFNNLTERELLIQLYAKMETVERAVNKIVDNSRVTQNSIIELDKRVTKNESNIESFCKALDGIVAKWNMLLTFFLTLLVGVIVSVIARFINGKKVKA